MSLPQQSRYGRWRAATLGAVYVLMVLHVIHWKLNGKTLAPLELNEVMYTFELGIITAGFVFMAVVLLATAIFGRFFCSWGCHILALQDLCAWILTKLHIRPAGIRSRLLLWVPLAAAFYMFVWPQVTRSLQGQPLPKLHLATDGQGWASFITEDFWRNLPGLGVTLFTFGLCGFAVVYVLGSRAFCSYGCPYGAIFGLADKLAPGRIRVGDDCKQCGTCTAVCTSHIRVHEEVNRYGMVIDSACMKDLDCVSACPQQTLRFGFGIPALVAPTVGQKQVRKKFDFTWPEEATMAVVFVASLLIYRGLYNAVPFLSSLGLGVLLAYLTVVTLRLAHQPAVRFNRWFLKKQGRLLARGWVFVAVASMAVVFTLHSGMIRYHQFQGERYSLLADLASGQADLARSAAINHLEFVDRWGLVEMRRTDAVLAGLYSKGQQWQDAEKFLNRLSANYPTDARWRISLAKALTPQGRAEEALAQYRAALELNPRCAETHYAVSGLYFEAGRPGDAMTHLTEAVRLRPEFPEAQFDLGALLVRAGDLTSGIDHLRQAISLRPYYGDAHYNLAVALAMNGQIAQAEEQIQRALEIQPQDEQTQAFHNYLEGITKQDPPSPAKSSQRARGGN